MNDTTMAKYPHLDTRGLNYYFRMRVPVDLLKHYGKEEIKFSLRTKDYAEAKRKVAIETARYFNEFEQVRKHDLAKPLMKITPEDIQRIADEFTHDVLAGDEAERKSGSVSREHQVAIEVLEEHARPVLAGDGRHDDSRRWIARMVHNFVDGLNFKLAPNSEAESELIYALSAASIRVVDAISERDKGKVVPTPMTAYAAVPNVAYRSNNDPSSRLSDVIKKYSLEQTSAGNWTEKTALENRAVFKLLITIIGDLSVSDFGFFHAVKFKETIVRLPANLNKSPLYRDRKVHEILDMTGVKPMSITTVNKYLTRLSSLLDWACKHGYVPKNFAEGMAIPQRGKKASEDRDMFEVRHLDAIFNAIAERRVTISGNLSSFHYWAPLLGYLTAGRVNEIASLRLSDFKRVDGIPFISIQQQNDGESTKTKAGRRELPLHTKLIQLGLLQHIQQLKEAGETRLFPELSLLKHKGYGAKITSWFSGHDSKEDSFLWRDAGIKEGKLTFHSFRHTMATSLERAGVPETLQKRILGHSLKNNLTADRYSKGVEMVQMLDVITKALSEDPLRGMPVYADWIKR
jgi:integrase